MLSFRSGAHRVSPCRFLGSLLRLCMPVVRTNDALGEVSQHRTRQTYMCLLYAGEFEGNFTRSLFEASREKRCED
jgi:hypothetical protein